MRMKFIFRMCKIIEVRNPFVGTLEDITSALNSICLQYQAGFGKKRIQTLHLFLPARGRFPIKPLTRQSEGNQLRYATLRCGLCNIVDAVHTLTHPRRTTVAGFARITSVRQVQRFLAVFSSPLGDTMSSYIIGFCTNPFTIPPILRHRSEYRLFIRHPTLGASVTPNISFFIYHRLQNSITNP